MSDHRPRARPRETPADRQRGDRRCSSLAVIVAGVFGVRSEGDATFRLALPGDIFAAAEPGRAGGALRLRRRGAPRLLRRAPVHARRGAALERLPRHRPVPGGDGVPGLGDGGQIVLADRHAAGDGRARGADRAWRPRRGPLRARRASSISASRACCSSGAFTGAVVGSLAGSWLGLVAAVARRRAVSGCCLACW